MHNCSNCGQGIGPDVKFCRHCGAPATTPSMGAPVAPTPTGALACNDCGKTNAQGARFCKGCGAPLLTQAAAPSPAPISRPAPSPGPVAAGVAAPAGAQACPGCGKDNDAGTRFCKGCGASLQPGAQHDAITQPSPLSAAPLNVPSTPSAALASSPLGATQPPAQPGQNLGAAIAPPPFPKPDAGPNTGWQDDTANGGGTTTDGPSRGVRIAKVLVIALVMAGIAVGSFFYFRGRQTPVDTQANAQAVAGTASQGGDEAAKVAAVLEAATAAHMETEALAERKAEAARKAEADAEAKKRRAGKQKTEPEPAAAPQKKTSGQMENDIFKQLQEKKKSLGVE